MDNQLKQDALIEDALRSQSLAPMPRSITVDVMSHIQKDTRPAFLTWNDFALSLVIALCIGALLLTMQLIPPVLAAKIQIQGILLYQGFLVNARWLVPSLFFGMASLLSAFAIPSLLRMTMDDRR
jgi:hypothetical protein